MKQNLPINIHKMFKIKFCENIKGCDCNSFHCKIKRDGSIEVKNENAKITLKICKDYYNDHECKFYLNCKNLHLNIHKNTFEIQETLCNILPIRKTSAGILPYTIYNNQIYFLLGKELKNNQTLYSDFGGKYSYYDKSTLHTAARGILTS
jgi:hypothetical protein